MQDDVIRASELGLYVFCARAWRLRADGYESRNVAEMAAGSEAHAVHGRRIAAYQWIMRLSIVLGAVAVISLALWWLAR